MVTVTFTCRVGGGPEPPGEFTTDPLGVFGPPQLLVDTAAISAASTKRRR
jgi:hypothetical protein